MADPIEFRNVNLHAMLARFVGDIIAEEVEPGAPISAEQRAQFEARARQVTWLAEKRAQALDLANRIEAGESVPAFYPNRRPADAWQAGTCFHGEKSVK